MKKRIRAVYDKMIGIFLDDVVGGVTSLTDIVSRESEKLLRQARMDGEDEWFLPDCKVREHDTR